jgi:hypothetical protein
LRKIPLKVICLELSKANEPFVSFKSRLMLFSVCIQANEAMVREDGTEVIDCGERIAPYGGERVGNLVAGGVRRLDGVGSWWWWWCVVVGVGVGGV